MDKLVDNKMINKIEKLLQEARTHVAVEVNNTLLRTYMEIGKLLVEDINLHENEENYQNKTISMLSKELTRKFGKGFSRANIWNMITFYKEYGSVQTLSERLSWSYYCELLSISDKDKRHFYEVECANSRWSVRELRRQIASSLFERLLLSDTENMAKWYFSMFWGRDDVYAKRGSKGGYFPQCNNRWNVWIGSKRESESISTSYQCC